MGFFLGDHSQRWSPFFLSPRRPNASARAKGTVGASARFGFSMSDKWGRPTRGLNEKETQGRKEEHVVSFGSLRVLAPWRLCVKDSLPRSTDGERGDARAQSRKEEHVVASGSLCVLAPWRLCVRDSLPRSTDDERGDGRAQSRKEEHVVSSGALETPCRGRRIAESQRRICRLTRIPLHPCALALETHHRG